jgi:hypothetical protein
MVSTTHSWFSQREGSTRILKPEVIVSKPKPIESFAHTKRAYMCEMRWQFLSMLGLMNVPCLYPWTQVILAPSSKMDLKYK